MNDLIAVFDFCSTLVSFETGDRFVEYIIEQIGNEQLIKKMNKIRKNRDCFFTKIKRKIFNYNYNYKRKILKLIEGLNKEDIDLFAKNYYFDEVKLKLIKETNVLLNSFKKKGFKIVILSAGYYPYIKYYALDNEVDDIIANEFKYDSDNRFTGKFKDKDCYGKEKVNAFKRKYNSYSTLVFVSDSMSDLPMFNLADIKYFACKNNNIKLPIDWRIIKWD